MLSFYERFPIDNDHGEPLTREQCKLEGTWGKRIFIHTIFSIIGISRQNIIFTKVCIQASAKVEIISCCWSLSIDVSTCAFFYFIHSPLYRNAEYLSEQLEKHLSKEQLIQLAIQLECFPYRDDENTCVDDSLLLECIVNRIVFYPWKYETFYVSSLYDMQLTRPILLHEKFY